MVDAGARPARPGLLDRSVAKAECAIHGSRLREPTRREVAARRHEPEPTPCVGVRGEPDERCRAGRGFQHRTYPAARVLAAEPAVASKSWCFAGCQPGQIVLAAVGNDHLAGRVIDRLDLVVDRSPAEALRHEHGHSRQNIAGTGPRHPRRGGSTERPARRDPDRLAEPKLGHMAVEGASVEPVVRNEILQGKGRAERAGERFARVHVVLERP